MVILLGAALSHFRDSRRNPDGAAKLDRSRHDFIAVPQPHGKIEASN